MQKLTIHGEMTDLNEYIDANRVHRQVGARIKKEETQRVHWECRAQRIKPCIGKINASYYIYTKDSRKDEDNNLIAIKFINDGIKEAGIIKSDSAKCLHIKHIEVNEDKGKPRIEIVLEEA